jgi:hypothetical protein
MVSSWSGGVQKTRASRFDPMQETAAFCAVPSP